MCETKERIVEVLKPKHEGWIIGDNSISVNILNTPYYAKECRAINRGEIVSVLYRAIMPVIESVSVHKDTNGEDKTVVIKFADGTTERASTRHGDTFDLETGISLCVAKKLYTTLANDGKSSGFSKIVHKAVKIYKNGIKEEEARKKREAEEKLAEQRKEAKRKKRAEKRRQRKVNILKDAFVAAFNETKKEG